MKRWKVGLLIIALTLFWTACSNPAEETKAVPTMMATGRETVVEARPGTAEPETAAKPPTGQEVAATEETAASITTPIPDTPEPAAPAEPISVEAADGLAIRGTFYPGAGQGPWPGVLLLHMNGRMRQDWDRFARQLADRGYAAMAVDMRGFGETGGMPNWDQAGDDLQRVWSYLAGREDIDEGRTAAVGASIGANMALVIAAAEPAIRAVVLLSPGLNYFGVSTDEAIVTYGQRPLLIVASEEDVEAARSSQALQELAQGEAQLQMYNGAGHGTGMFGPQPELAGLIIDWLADQLGHEPGAVSESIGLPDSGLPEPGLFEVSWDDRTPFAGGLIPAERAVLDKLPGASIYHMDLAIAPDLHSVEGKMEVRYTNQEDVPLDVLYFHLFPNLLGGKLAVKLLTVNGEGANPEYVSYTIDSGSADSAVLPESHSVDTVMWVPLPSPLAPGEQVVIGLSFTVEVPTEGGSNYGVFAIVDDVLALAHFYPQVAVYDDEGWNIELPAPNADVTYADSSFYLVRLTAPANQVIVSSGTEIDRQVTGDEKTVVIATGPTRDFYLASSDRYLAVHQSVGETTVTSYGFPGNEAQNRLALDYASGALESYNRRFGPYPFTEFDIAPTPNLALGVEYPGVVVINSALYDENAQLSGRQTTSLLESTVSHEAAHQWFYSVVGNDQLDEPWVDESLTQYATYLYFLDTYGQEAADGFRQSWLSRWDRVDRADIPIGQQAGAYSPLEYSAIVYGRGPLFFDRLAEELGESLFDQFLRSYTQRFKWGIATAEGLKDLVEETCGCDVDPLFAEWVGRQ